MKKSDPNSRTMMSRGKEIVQYILYSEKEKLFLLVPKKKKKKKKKKKGAKRKNKLFYGLHHREGQA